MTSFNIYDHATQQQIDSFKPTILYIKQHSKTGLLYLGKTTKMGKAFDQYKGSGRYWTRHLKQHGIDSAENIWWCLFTDISSLVETALSLSKTQDIVHTSDNGKKLWANCCYENGLDGGNSSGRIITEEYRAKLRASHKHHINPPDAIERQKKAAKSTAFSKYTSEVKKKMSDRKIGKSVYKDKHGNKIQMFTDDPRVISGEFVGINSERKRPEEECISISKRQIGTTVYKKATDYSIRTRMSTNDPRVLSGEYIGITAGIPRTMKCTPQQISQNHLL